MNNVDVRVKFNNAVSKEKSSGATSILEVWKHKHTPIEDNNTHISGNKKLEIAYKGTCITCGEEFKIGVKRIKWRLQLPTGLIFTTDHSLHTIAKNVY